MIPQECVATEPVIQTLYQTLYNQLGPGYKVVQHLNPPSLFKGRLFWIENEHQSLFIAICDKTQGDAGFIQSQAPDIKTLLQQSEILSLLKFQQSLLPRQLQTHKARLVPLMIIFPHISQQILNRQVASLGLFLLGHEVLKNLKLGKIIHKLLGRPYSQAVHHYIRHVFSPEVLLAENTNSLPAQLKNYVLDKEQEIAVKADIALPQEKARIHNYNLTGVNGSTSSGKTETLIKRATLINTIHPEQNLLVIGYNKAATENLVKRCAQYQVDNDRTEIFSLNQWCKQQLRPESNLVEIDEISDIINSLIYPRLKKHGISLAIFINELDFIFGRAIFYENDYIKAKHHAQPYHLNKEHYPHIWKAALTLKSELSVRGWKLWSELPQILWETLQKAPVTNQYDHILVDDAHLFPPIAFELFKRVLKPKTGQLFITQEPNQGITNPCQLWHDTGLDLRGYSTRLHNYYRINPYILNAANAFYLNRLPDDTDKHILQNLPVTADKPIPELLHFHAKKDEENRLLNEIKKQIQQGTPLVDMLIITAKSETSHYLSRFIEDTLGITVDILDENLSIDQAHRRGLGICHILQAQGLVVPHVFIFGLEEIIENESHLETDTQEHQALLVENTRKITMAMTRARKGLTLFLTAVDIPKPFITPHIRIPTANESSTADIRYLRKA